MGLCACPVLVVAQPHPGEAPPPSPWKPDRPPTPPPPPPTPTTHAPLTPGFFNLLVIIVAYYIATTMTSSYYDHGSVLRDGSVTLETVALGLGLALPVGLGLAGVPLCDVCVCVRA